MDPYIRPLGQSLPITILILPVHHDCHYTTLLLTTLLLFISSAPFLLQGQIQLDFSVFSQHIHPVACIQNLQVWAHAEIGFLDDSVDYKRFKLHTHAWLFEHNIIQKISTAIHKKYNEILLVYRCTFFM